MLAPKAGAGVLDVVLPAPNTGALVPLLPVLKFGVEALLPNPVGAVNELAVAPKGEGTAGVVVAALNPPNTEFPVGWVIVAGAPPNTELPAGCVVAAGAPNVKGVAVAGVLAPLLSAPNTNGVVAGADLFGTEDDVPNGAGVLPVISIHFEVNAKITIHTPLI